MSTGLCHKIGRHICSGKGWRSCTYPFPTCTTKCTHLYVGPGFWILHASYIFNNQNGAYISNTISIVHAKGSDRTWKKVKAAYFLKNQYKVCLSFLSAMTVWDCFVSHCQLCNCQILLTSPDFPDSPGSVAAVSYVRRIDFRVRVQAPGTVRFQWFTLLGKMERSLSSISI